MGSRIVIYVLAVTFTLVTAAPFDGNDGTRIEDGIEPQPYDLKNGPNNEIVFEVPELHSTSNSAPKQKDSGTSAKRCGGGSSGNGSASDGSKSKCSCGIANSNSTRIVNGMNAQPNEFPWQVYLILRVGQNSYSCGGSIISKKHIITAAHCTTSPDRKQPGRVRVILGLHNLRQDRPLEPRVAKVINHEKYQQTRNKLDYDISIVELAEELPLHDNPKIGAVCLPSSGEDHTGKNVIISGWGRMQDGESPFILQKTQYQIASQSECKKVWYGKITDRMICAGGSGRTSSCQGDSGGPMTYIDNGHHELAGLVSFGTKKCNAPGYFDVYTRVANPELMAWIKKHSEGTETCN